MKKIWAASFISHLFIFNAVRTKFLLICESVLIHQVTWVPVTTARRVLGLRVEETALRYGG